MIPMNQSILHDNTREKYLKINIFMSESYELMSITELVLLERKQSLKQLVPPIALRALASSSTQLNRLTLGGPPGGPTARLAVEALLKALFVPGFLKLSSWSFCFGLSSAMNSSMECTVSDRLYPAK